jgi:hypothetical protein
MIEDVMVWVVLTGRQKCEVAGKIAAEFVSAATPRTGCNLTIRTHGSGIAPSTNRRAQSHR